VKKSNLIFGIIAGMFSGIAHAQISSRVDQFYLDPSALNPAAIVFQPSSSVNLFYNKAFSGITGAPESVIANLVIPLKNNQTGFGLFYLREKSGFQQLHNAYATYAYAFPLGDDAHLSFAASLGVLSQSFDASKAIYIQTNDPVIRSIAYGPTATRADFRASTMLQAGGFVGGFAFSRLAKPRFDYTYYNYKASYNLQSLSNLILGYNIVAGEDWSIKPMLLFNFYDFKYANFRGNVSAYYQNKFWAGFNTDASSQVGFNVGFRALNAITCGYSVNFLAGKMKGILGPVHEFYTSIPFGGGKKASIKEIEKNSITEETEEEVTTTPLMPMRRLVETNVNSFSELKNAPTDLDTAGIHLAPINKEQKEPGIYLVAGMHVSEVNADNHVKSLYLLGTNAYKFYDPINKSYYVWIKQFKSMAEASLFVQNTDNKNLPEAWIRVVK